MIYIFIIIILVLLSIHYDIHGNTKGKKFCIRLVLFVFIMMAGLRYRIGIDTIRYIGKFYNVYPYLWELSWDDFSIGSDPLFMLLNSIVKSIGCRFYVVQILHALFVNLLIFNYVRKHSKYIFTFLLFYFVIFYYGYNADVMRASMSIVVCLYANDFILQKNYVKGFLLYLIGCLFHISTVLLLVTPLLFKLKLNYLSLCIGAFIFVLSGFVQDFLTDNIALLLNIDIVYGKLDGYIEQEENLNDKLNILGYIFKIIPCIYPVLYLLWLKYKRKESGLLCFEPIVTVGVLFAIATLRVPLLYRYVDFYLVYFYIIDAHLFVEMVKSYSREINIISIVRPVVIFVPLFFVTYKSWKDLYLYDVVLPYSSVIERSVDEERERVYEKEHNLSRYDYPFNKY